MRSLFETIGRVGIDTIMGPERFREFLVIVFTGLGGHPAEIIHAALAWGMALLVADRIYPRETKVRSVTLRLQRGAAPRPQTQQHLHSTRTLGAGRPPH